MLILIVVALILLACLGAFAFFYSQIKMNKHSQAERPVLGEKVSEQACARCNQLRLIVNKEAGLCAFCWSSMRTKAG